MNMTRTFFKSSTNTHVFETFAKYNTIYLIHDKHNKTGKRRTMSKTYTRV